MYEDGLHGVVTEKLWVLNYRCIVRPKSWIQPIFEHLDLHEDLTDINKWQVIREQKNIIFLWNKYNIEVVVKWKSSINHKYELQLTKGKKELKSWIGDVRSLRYVY